VLRYRAQAEESADVRLLQDFGGRRPPAKHLLLTSHPPVEAAVGCEGPVRVRPLGVMAIRCPLPPEPRYRFSFNGHNRFKERSGLDDWAYGAFQNGVRGVIYAGAGNDVALGGDRIYGGPGDDTLEGLRAYGGPGGDRLAGAVAPFTSDQVVLRGGRGDDRLRGPGHVYGGPGDDLLEAASWIPEREMLVGGPGRDIVRLYHQHKRVGDVVRLRGGGTDRVACTRTFNDPKKLQFDAVLFVDRSDRVDPHCRGVRVLLTERPRYPYP
jgi:hypothetical protein